MGLFKEAKRASIRCSNPLRLEVTYRNFKVTLADISYWCGEDAHPSPVQMACLSYDHWTSTCYPFQSTNIPQQEVKVPVLHLCWVTWSSGPATNPQLLRIPSSCDISSSCSQDLRSATLKFSLHEQQIWTSAFVNDSLCEKIYIARWIWQSLA